MFGLTLLSPRVIAEMVAAAAIAGLLWWGYTWVYDRGAESVRIEWDAVKLEQAQESAKVTADALKITKDLQDASVKEREKKDAQIKTLNASLNTALSGLLKRPSRDSAGNLPINPTTGSTIGATGADLSRQDAAFSLREAARADSLRLQLVECQAKYNAARDKVN